jgi:ABC-type antimicrobial peptide transport system permease subunit
MFGALALLVAMVGVYSVVAFDAAQRRNEFGIRVALGARGLDLARLLLGQGLRYGVAGGLLGVALILVAGRFIASQLFHTSPHDPVALAAVAALMLLAMGCACLVPARSAARADPRVSLQAD